MSFKTAVCFILIFVLLLAVFSLSALAADQYVTLPVGTSINGYPTLTVGTSARGDFKVNASTEGVYVFIYPSLDETNPPHVVAVYTDDTAVVNMGYSNNFSRAISYYSDTYHVYYVSNTPSPADALTAVYVPVYDTRDEGLADIAQHLGVYTPPPSLEYTLPPGNIAYIPIPAGMSSQIPYTLTTTFPMAFGNNDLSRVNQVVTVSSTLPSGSSTQAPSSPPIQWVNNGSINLFGISAQKIYNGTVSNSLGGYYLVVSNPMTMKSESGLIGGDVLTNPSINITMSAVAGSPIIYPMSDRLVITDGYGIDSESTFGDEGYTFEIDPDTGEIIWTAPDGSNSAPVAGGNNPMPTPNTIFDWLRNISTQLADFLKGPVNAVQIVVSAIRDFMGSFTQLYQWLPSPVYSLITSALMIALTIGVIKIFV